MDQSPPKRPKMRTLAERDAYFAERQRINRENNAGTKGKNRRKPVDCSSLVDVMNRMLKGETNGVWSGFDGDYVLDSIATPLVDHGGWSREDAIAFAEEAIQTLDRQGGTLCGKCGERASGASEQHGPCCVACLLDLECEVILPDDPAPDRIGQRRGGILPGDE